MKNLQRINIFILFIFPFLIACSSENIDRASEREEILEVLSMQQNAWNDGDIAAFMEGYYKSDSLMFIGANGITQGHSATLERYYNSYPDRAAMGKLEFTLLDLRPIDTNTWFMTGNWKLTRENDTPGGVFTLLWQKRAGKWCIIADHTQ